jgi:hypothetical protein
MAASCCTPRWRAATWCAFGVIKGIEHEDRSGADTRIGSSAGRYYD